jgi:hypothetical protein
MNKIVNVNNPGGITKKQEQMLMKAYEDYADTSEIKVPQREHLGASFRKGVSCDHKWKLAPVTDECSLWFKKNFEEEDADPGEYCSNCGATVLREDGKIWAYDGTTRFFGKIPKTRPEARREFK